jgi:hypothetical protein
LLSLFSSKKISLSFITRFVTKSLSFDKGSGLAFLDSGITKINSSLLSTIAFSNLTPYFD